MRDRVSKKLKEAVQAIGYSDAGTVEFLMDEIRIAGGETLADIPGGPVTPRGHAIECRINAENPETFVPSPGRITGLNLPGGGGIRVDTHAYQDGVIPPYYDSPVAKPIAHGRDREEAIQRMKRALDLFVVEGIHTSIPLHKRIMNEPDFVAGHFDTNFIKRWMQRLSSRYPLRHPLANQLDVPGREFEWHEPHALKVRARPLRFHDAGFGVTHDAFGNMRNLVCEDVRQQHVWKRALLMPVPTDRRPSGHGPTDRPGWIERPRAAPEVRHSG